MQLLLVNIEFPSLELHFLNMILANYDPTDKWQPTQRLLWLLSGNNILINYPIFREAFEWQADTKKLMNFSRIGINGRYFLINYERWQYIVKTRIYITVIEWIYLQTKKCKTAMYKLQEEWYMYIGNITVKFMLWMDVIMSYEITL